MSYRSLKSIADELDAAPRQGAETDYPEGARFIALSDTLAREIAARCRAVHHAMVPRTWEDADREEIMDEMELSESTLEDILIDIDREGEANA